MKKTTSILLGLCVLGAAGFLGITALSSKPTDSKDVDKEKQKSLTVEVIHKDGTKATYEYVTDQSYLGDLLLEEGLIAGEEGPYGLFVKEVDDEKSNFEQDGSWCQLLTDGKPADQGVDETLIEDGSVYTWTYTKE